MARNPAMVGVAGGDVLPELEGLGESEGGSCPVVGEGEEDGGGRDEG